jgi:3-hydroxymyristoyl/3-hydroxydecanoyl-(acyl carrier protein) dehydratase
VSGPPPSFTRGFALIERPGEGSSDRFIVKVDDDCPHCDDHFPGDPIVPAIAQLELLVALAQLDGKTGDPAGIDNLKLRGALRPGDRLTVRLASDASGRRTRFSLHRGDDLLTECTMRWAAGESR